MDHLRSLLGFVSSPYMETASHLDRCPSPYAYGAGWHTHLLSDGRGLSAGFRYGNEWLAVLTNHIFADSFYRGDALGSFNSLMRFVTEVLFAVATGGLALPFLDQEMKRGESALAEKLNAYHRKTRSALQAYTSATEMYHDRSLDNR
jgi:hypothetical protein